MSDPTSTQEWADAIKLQAHGADAADVPPAVVDVPHVTGTGTVGSTLNCTMGNWENEPTSYAYQWKAGATDIGAGTADYVVAAEAVGQDIVCVVTAINAFGSTVAPPSNAVTITETGTGTAAQEAAPARAHERAPHVRGG